MTDPEEILDDWEKQIKTTRDKGLLKAIIQDMKMELNDAENWVSRYESLIDDAEGKLEDLK